MSLVGRVGLASLAHATEEPSETPRPNVVVGGHVETFYQWNFNQPSNGITNFRGFDNRHNTFTLSNAVIDAAGSLGPVSARIALQTGHTPETYYLFEPTSLGTGAAGTSGPSVWKFIQQANAGYRVPIGRGLLLESGLFLSPIGPEGFAVKDNWNWSRSTVFFGLPFYYTGARVTYGLTERLSATLHLCNGWNSVVDNNPEKSIAAQVTYLVADQLTWNFVYFAGVERAPGAPEGRGWRDLVDSYLGWHALPWLSMVVHGNLGYEPTRFGAAYWLAGALSVRVQPLSWLYLAGRADHFFENVPEDDTGQAASIFWPSAQVSSQTLTVDVRARDNVSFRLEFRHDQAGDPMFFRGPVSTDATGAFITNATSQNTLTAGMTAWF